MRVWAAATYSIRLAGPMSQPLGGRVSFDGWEGKGGRTDAPAGGVKVLAGGTDGEGDLFYLGGQSSDAGEGDVVEAVVDFVGEDDDLVFDADVGNLLQLLTGVDLADRVVLEVSVSGPKREGVRREKTHEAC